MEEKVSVRRKKRVRLVPGLRKLRRRLPGRRALRPVAVAMEPEPVADWLPSAVRRKPTMDLPVQVDYGPDIQRVGDAVRALGDRVDQMARKAPSVQVDYTSDIQRLEGTVLALGNRVDVQAKTAPPVQVDYDPNIRELGDAILALGDRVDQMARREG